MAGHGPVGRVDCDVGARVAGGCRRCYAGSRRKRRGHGGDEGAHCGGLVMVVVVGWRVMLRVSQFAGHNATYRTSKRIGGEEESPIRVEDRKQTAQRRLRIWVVRMPPLIRNPILRPSSRTRCGWDVYAAKPVSMLLVSPSAPYNHNNGPLSGIIRLYPMAMIRAFRQAEGPASRRAVRFTSISSTPGETPPRTQPAGIIDSSPSTTAP
jgi:hypothetical protein